MKKLHGIKIIYISKKKRKISNARNEFSDEEETKEFRDSQKTVSPTIGKDRLRIWKAWMDPITRQLSPSRGPPSSPEKHHRAPTRFKVFVFTAKANLASVHSSDARLLDTTNIVARFQASLRALVSSSYFIAGMGRRDPTKITWIDDIWWWKIDRITLNLTCNSNDNLFDRWIFPSFQWE